MISVAPAITADGKNLLIRAISGETITFTRFKIGNGTAEDFDISALSDLINPLVEFDINDIDTSDTGYVKLTGSFDNTYITTDFYWRELGIFCKGEDNIEILYAYANDGDNAGLLRSSTSDIVTEQTVSLVIAVGDAENVTAILSESAIYTTKSEFESHTQNKQNPHNVTAEQVGLGNVPNVQTNDQTPTYVIASSDAELVSGERLGTAFGKIAKAVKSLIAHMKNTNNPHNIKPDAIGAANSQHSHTTSDIISGTLSTSRGGTGVSNPAMGGIIKANGSNPCTVLRGTGALYSPSIGSPTFGILPASMGGTGVGSLNAFRSILGATLIFGEYTGDDEHCRYFNLGYRPKLVKIICDRRQSKDTLGGNDNIDQYNGIALDGLNSVHDNNYLYTDVSAAPEDYYRDIKIAIVDYGFYVYQSSSVLLQPKLNANNQKYHYIIAR